MSREFDLVVLGATGFTGRQAAAYLAGHAPDGLRWAVAGRREEAVAAVASRHGVPYRVVDTNDGPAVDSLAAQTVALITTVGPYAKYGTPVVRACVAHGTHYADITGETPWVRSLLDTLGDAAVDSGAKLVPFCGFDSVPSDLGAFVVARFCNRVLGQPCDRVVAAFSMTGGLNGGTLATALHMGETGTDRAMRDPFLLDPPEVRQRPDKKEHYDPRGPTYIDELGVWGAPFFMGPVNTRVVRRSAALLEARGDGYGPAFSYQEYLKARSKGQARRITWATGAVFALAGTRLGRKVLRALGPSPGEGPSEETMDKGFFRVRLAGVAADGTRVQGRVEGHGDPGNRNTVRMLCEAGLLLATRAEDLPDGSGFLTPATAFGEHLVDALVAKGMTFEARLA